MGLPKDKYTSDDYLKENPSWDIEDSHWKANQVQKIISKNQLHLSSVCEVGCGAGGVLVNLKQNSPGVSFVGYDIAPAAKSFWGKYKNIDINYQLGDFFELDTNHYDAILLLDVLEHVPDPHKFLTDMKGRANYLIIHFPLDLSALNILRKKPLLHVRKKVGHIHYFSKDLALEFLKECGMEVLDWTYTGASFSAPQRTFKTKLFSLLRYCLSLFNKDASIRLLGGETMMVLIKQK